MDRAAIERALADCRPFSDPRIDLEQYPTPADIAAHVVHLAGLQGDLDRSVIDLGTGTGILALGSILAGAHDVVGLEADAVALEIARKNARSLDLEGHVSWLVGDVRRNPLCPTDPMTVIANPPFGAAGGHRGADRAFLETAAEIAAVSYTLHNAGSSDFVSSFVTDNGGHVSRRYRATFDVQRQYQWHDRDMSTIPVEVFRVEWPSNQPLSD